MELAYKNKNCGEITEKDLNSEFTLAGWTSTIRDLGGIIFVELRDRSGLFQIVADPKVNSNVYLFLINYLYNKGIFNIIREE